jgi:hypothetical protein
MTSGGEGCNSVFIILVAEEGYFVGGTVAQLIEALCYKQEGRGFDS